MRKIIFFILALVVFPSVSDGKDWWAVSEGEELWGKDLRGLKEQCALAPHKLKTLATEKGDVSAQICLGLLYYAGAGVSLNYSESAKWFRMAAQKGDAKAQYNLGHMYYFGEGVSLDHSEAVKWYQLAALQKNAWAQYYLGHMYYLGEGVPADAGKAVKWWKLAAQSGNAKVRSEAQLFLTMIGSIR